MVLVDCTQSAGASRIPPGSLFTLALWRAIIVPSHHHGVLGGEGEVGDCRLTSSSLYRGSMKAMEIIAECLEIVPPIAHVRPR